MGALIGLGAIAYGLTVITFATTLVQVSHQRGTWGGAGSAFPVILLGLVWPFLAALIFFLWLGYIAACVVGAMGDRACTPHKMRDWRGDR
jgi:hypothetical protein